MKQVTNKCPFCGKNGENCNNILIKKVRNSIVLLICDNDHIFGRAT